MGESGEVIFQPVLNMNVFPWGWVYQIPRPLIIPRFLSTNYPFQIKDKLASNRGLKVSITNKNTLCSGSYQNPFVGILAIFSTGTYQIKGTRCVESETCCEKYHEKKSYNY